MMIKAIEGVVTKKEPAFVILKTNSGVIMEFSSRFFAQLNLVKAKRPSLP